MEKFESIDELIAKISPDFSGLRFVKSNERAFSVEGDGFTCLFAYSEFPDGHKEFSSVYKAEDGCESAAMSTADAINDRLD